MDINRLNQLLTGYAQEKLTPSELDELVSFIQQEKNPATSLDLLAEEAWLNSGEITQPVLDVEDQQRILQAVFENHQRQGKVVRLPRKNYRYWAAAGVLLLIIAGGYFFLTNKNSGAEQEIAETKEISPGREGALLTLANGSKILLDTVQNGILNLDGGGIARVVNGQLIYDKTAQALAYHTMSTPLGRHFQVLLPDGTKAWLNAASAITYPTEFISDERLVKITGEVYFEVVEDKTKPFRVMVENLTKMEVLGTHFNINAYAQEDQIHTTLLEGSLRVDALNNSAKAGTHLPGNSNVVLSPGQQAQLRRQGNQELRLIKGVDVEKVMAWKEGAFNFDGLSLEQAVRQLERWYAIEVKIEEGVPASLPFSGKISRKMTLEKLLKLLENTELNFRIENNNRLVITK